MIKTIEATNNHYTVSDAGIIYKDNTEVQIKHQSNGYCTVPIKLIFGTRHFLVHQIVAAYFCNNDDPINKLQVNHIDGNKDNNSASNLEWCTNLENQRHRIDVLGKRNDGVNNPMYGKSGAKSPVYKGLIYQYDKNWNLIDQYEGSGNAAKQLNVLPCNILRAISSGKLYKGFYFTRNKRV